MNINFCHKAWVEMTHEEREECLREVLASGQFDELDREFYGETASIRTLVEFDDLSELPSAISKQVGQRSEADAP